MPRRRRELQIPSTTPDFLLSAMGSKNFMRLSLMKAAHEVIYRCRVVGNPSPLGMTKGRAALPSESVAG
jgi:hypothetical protein